jgi:hypothetical protein
MMSENCEKIQKIIDNWERKGRITGEDYSDLEKHLQDCDECAEKYRALVYFLRRDVPAEALAAEQPGFIGPRDITDRSYAGSGEDFTDRVMMQIREEQPKAESRWKGERGRRKAGFFRYAAAAAAILIIGGLVLRFTVLPLNERVTSGNGIAAETYIEVRFTLTAPEAEQVVLVGDFTDWETSKLELTDPDGDGVWEAKIKLQKDNVYEYNFIIDGERWIPDPNALMKVDDGFGGESSLLTL